MRVKHTVQLTVSEDTDQKQILFQRDATLAQVVIDNYERATSGLVSIAAAATENLPLGDVTNVKGLYLALSEEATVAINGSGDLIQMRKGGSASLAKLLIEADITEVAVTAPAAADLTGTFCVWGDPAA